MTHPTFTQARWSLKDLSGGAPDEIEAAFSGLEQAVQQVETLRPTLQAEMAFTDFMSVVHQMESLEQMAYRLYGYASLSFAADTQDQAALTLMGRVEQFLAEMTNRTLFFSLWWKALDDANAARLMQNAGDFTYWLEEMRHFKTYTLSEPEEKIINLKNVTGASAMERLYDSFTNRYTFKLEVDGEARELTRGELMVYVRQHDPELRARAYQELYRVYGEDGPILGQMYQTIVRDWRNENLSLRGYTAPSRCATWPTTSPTRWSTPCWMSPSATRPSSSATSSSKRAGWGWSACGATMSTPRWPNRTSRMTIRRRRRHGARFLPASSTPQFGVAGAARV